MPSGNLYGFISTRRNSATILSVVVGCPGSPNCLTCKTGDPWFEEAELLKLKLLNEFCRGLSLGFAKGWFTLELADNVTTRLNLGGGCKL